MSPDSIAARDIVIGAGPAGLTAALELTRLGYRPLVLEASAQIGGISRTEAYKGYLFDIGGHRFYTKVPEVEQLWHSLLNADEFRTTPRLSRIYFDGKFYKYPLEIFDALGNIGVVESLRSLASYARARLTPHAAETTLEQWVTNRFGRRLYERFFRTYTEKVWGVPCSKIGADWAAQRIQGLSLHKTVWNALTGGRGNTLKTLINEFKYPRCGPGMMWERAAAQIEARGGKIWRGARVAGLQTDGARIQAIQVECAGERQTIPVRSLISSMPLSTLIGSIQPAPPDLIRTAASSLRYRDFLIVCLIIDQERLFPDNWLYIHSPTVRVGRIQNFKNWSAEMVPDPSKTSLGMEYFCNRGDDLWTMADADLIALASRELETLGLARARDVRDGIVIRQLAAYPFYDMDYQQNLAILRGYLAAFGNLQTVGRNGLHRYNNQDHSMLTGLLAARNVAGGHNDLWDVNTERSYQETWLVKDDTP